jgi:hypothetical protein
MGLHRKKNKPGNDFRVNKIGGAGILTWGEGFYFSKTKNKNSVKFHTVVAGEKTSE